MRKLKGVFAALFLGAVAQAFGRVASKIFEMTTAADDAASAFATTFGPATRDAQRFLDEFAHSAGLTIQRGRELMTTAGAIAQGLGFTKEASAALSEDVLRLAGDFQAFKDVPIEQAARAITSALTGEREALKTLGVVIRETDVQKRALADTGKANAEALTDEEKAAATMALIYERAGVVVGQLERESDSLRSRVRQMRAEFQDGALDIARRFTPALESVVGAFNDASSEAGGPLKAALMEAADAFSELAQQANLRLLFSWLLKGLTLLTRGLIAVVDGITDFRLAIDGGFARSMGRFLGLIAEGLGALGDWARMLSKIVPSYGAIADGLEAAEAKVRAQAEAQAELGEEMGKELEAQRAARAARRAAAGATDDLADALSGAAEAGENASDANEDLAETTEKAASALEKAAKQVREYRQQLSELQGPARARIVALEREAWLLERNLRIQAAIIAVQARGVPTAEARGVNEVVDEFVLRQAVNRRLQEQAQGEAFDAIQLVDIPTIEEQEEVVLSALQRMTIAAGDFQREWAVVGDALAGTFGNLAGAMEGFYEASGQKSKEAFALYKAFAIGEAIASTYLAANKALAEVPFPFNVGAAASIVALGLANVARIASASPGGGGGGSASTPGRSNLTAGVTLAQNTPRPERPAPALPPTVNVNVQTESRIEAVDGFAVVQKIRAVERLEGAGLGRPQPNGGR